MGGGKEVKLIRYPSNEAVPWRKAHIDTIVVHSYCLTWNKKHLSSSTNACVAKAIELKKQFDPIEEKRNRIRLLISNAYPELSVIEKSFKDRIFANEGIPKEDITHINDITDTHDEIRRICDIVEQTHSRALLVIADRYHLSRSLPAFHSELPKDVSLYGFPVTPDRYEITREIGGPLGLIGIIKSIRLGFKSLWIIWNFLLIKLQKLLQKSN